MTEGTSQGLFIVVAIVIFGIFISLSYTLFGKTLQPQVVALFDESFEQVNVKTARYTDILSVRNHREINSNMISYAIDNEELREGSILYTRTTLRNSSTDLTYSMNTPLKKPDLKTTLWEGKNLEFSVTFRSNAIGENMKFTLSDGGGIQRTLLGVDKVTGDWQTIKVLVPDFTHDLTLYKDKGAYAHLMLHMANFDRKQHVDIQEFRVRISD